MRNIPRQLFIAIFFLTATNKGEECDGGLSYFGEIKIGPFGKGGESKYALTIGVSFVSSIYVLIVAVKTNTVTVYFEKFY